MQIALYQADITPPLGHPLCAGWYPPAQGISDRLSANGIVIFPAEAEPIVLCALDWAELSNGEYELWKEKLACAAGTTKDRVTVHCVHGHDTPWPDRDAQEILDRHRHPDLIMHREWCDEALEAVVSTLGRAIETRRRVTEIRAGKAPVEQIASNRRIIDPDGKSVGVRLTRCRDPRLREHPEGLIDPCLKTISFWDETEKLAAVHYYAVHPTSYDGTGWVTPDFAGLARDRLASQESVPHLYFTECAGNITAGKYNDGALENRELFTQRMIDAMIASEKASRPYPPTVTGWATTEIHLPPREEHSPEKLIALLETEQAALKTRSRAALILAYQQRCQKKIPITISALQLGGGVVSLHLPGEAFIEYQLYAQALRPDLFVVVPSYGDCGPGYITLARSFAEGGYEPIDSFCSEASETILKEAIHRLMTSIPEFQPN